MVEKCVHEVFGASSPIAVLSIDQILADDIGELRVLQESPTQAIEGRGETRNRGCHENPSAAQYTVCFAKCLDTVVSVRQVIEWAKQDHGIRRAGVPGQSAGVADFGAFEWSFRLA